MKAPTPDKLNIIIVAFAFDPNEVRIGEEDRHGGAGEHQQRGKVKRRSRMVEEKKWGVKEEAEM